MLYPIAALLAGLVLLVWSADKFVAGSASTAKNLGMSPLLIGLTIVAFGTSAPEILVSIMAAISGSGSLAVGNALGSNIANIGLVLGITALIAPLPVKSGVLKKELPLLLFITIVAGTLFLNFELGLIDSLILISLLIMSLYLFTRFQKNTPEDTLSDSDEIEEMSTKRSLFWLFTGLTVLIGSSKMLVWGATEIATAMGVSELVIGLTIVAIGTSLPELAASVVSAMKGHHDIAIGNVVGSNIFNLAAVMAIPGFFAPVALESAVLYRDYLTVLAFTVLLIGFAIWQKPPTISKLEGGIMALLYAGYMVLLYNSAT